MLGTAVAPMAHVLNNILNILTLRIDAVRTEPGITEQAQEDLAACERSLKRQAEILESVSRFASYVVSRVGMGPADAAEALREAVGFSDSLFHRKFACETRIASDFVADVSPEGIALLFMGLMLLAAERNPERRSLRAEASGAGARAEAAVYVAEATPAVGERAELLLALLGNLAESCGVRLELNEGSSGAVVMRIGFGG